MSKKIVIAIDGPAGSGKSTVAKYLADKLGFIYLDTGAMYRAITSYCLDNDLIKDEKKIIEFARKSKIELKFFENKTLVFIEGEDVTEKIRSIEVNRYVSKIAAIPEVRNALVKKQQEFARDHNIVAEGRDTTTVVFPEADLKIYLDASLEERAKRRLNEFKSKNPEITLEEVIENIKERDKLDSCRDVSPLKKAAGAYLIDSTNKSLEEEFTTILNKLEEIGYNVHDFSSPS